MREEAKKLLNLCTNSSELKKCRSHKYVSFRDLYEYQYKPSNDESSKKSQLMEEKLSKIDFKQLLENHQSMAADLLGLSEPQDFIYEEESPFYQQSQFDVNNVMEYQNKMVRGEVRTIPPFEHLHRVLMPPEIIRGKRNEELSLPGSAAGSASASPNLSFMPSNDFYANMQPFSPDNALGGLLGGIDDSKAETAEEEDQGNIMDSLLSMMDDVTSGPQPSILDVQGSSATQSQRSKDFAFDLLGDLGGDSPPQGKLQGRPAADSKGCMCFVLYCIYVLYVLYVFAYLYVFVWMFGAICLI